MDRKLHIGIIGCGGIANGKHMPSLKKMDTVEMVAFCDIIEERAREGRQGIRRPRRKGLHRLPRAAAGYEHRRGARADPQPRAQLHHRGRAGRGQARHVRKAHGHQLRRGAEDARRRQAHRQEADHRLSEPLPSRQPVPQEGVRGRRSGRYLLRRARRPSAAAPCPPGACSWTRKSRAAVP